jgi:hypothetical protein
MTKSVQTNFVLEQQPIYPDYVVKSSYGNDSIALIQHLREYNEKHPLGKVVVLYNDTGWASSWWPLRVEKGESFARQCGFIPIRTSSIGMRELLHRHHGWPGSQGRFCTQELKIIPTHNWLSVHDPEGVAVNVCGVRRAESAERSAWPVYIENGPDEGRPQWSPLAMMSTAQRNDLVLRAGWEVLPHRSRECRCILANATDIVSWSEDDFDEINQVETELTQTFGQPYKAMFRPHKKAGRPTGIKAVRQWAENVILGRAQQPSESGCDSGYCSG